MKFSNWFKVWCDRESEIKFRAWLWKLDQVNAYLRILHCFQTGLSLVMFDVIIRIQISLMLIAVFHHWSNRQQQWLTIDQISWRLLILKIHLKDLPKINSDLWRPQSGFQIRCSRAFSIHFRIQFLIFNLKTSLSETSKQKLEKMYYGNDKKYSKILNMEFSWLKNKKWNWTLST